MDDTPDPLLNFFEPKEAEDPMILYKALGLQKDASESDIKGAYRKAALRFHPDKHSSKPDAEKEAMNKEFQKVGFAYAVLSNPARRKRYDEVGRTDESIFSDAEEMGWDAYFEQLFERIDRKVLDEHKEKYQGSQDELDDLIEAYQTCKGDFASILDHIPHSQHTDEARLKAAIEKLIADGKLTSTKKWVSSSGDKKAGADRSKKAAKEAKEAEETAKELGVWDEFYGDGKKGSRKSGKGKENAGGGGDSGEDALKAIMLKRQREREGGLDALAAKYAKIEEEGKKKRKGKKGQEEDVGGPPDISDADFEALQSKMMANKAKAKKGR